MTGRTIMSSENVMRFWMGLLLTSGILAATSVVASSEAKLTGRRLSANETQKTILGCDVYDQAGKCTQCSPPRYRLATDGTCDCAPGYVKTSTGACKRGGACANKCGQAYLPNGQGGKCGCDYWCDNHGDCCGGSANKNALCRTLVPTLNKARTGSCTAARSIAVTNLTSLAYQPSSCWCDDHCTANNDCCPLCTQPQCNKKQDAAASTTVGAAAVPSSTQDSKLRARVAAEAAALAGVDGNAGDCGIHKRMKAARASIAASGVEPANFEVTAESIMQQCQAADTGAPATAAIIPVYFTAGIICDDTECVGGDFTAQNVKDQMVYLNNMYARTGLQFTWDGVIHYANATGMGDIQDDDWVCNLKRYGAKPYKEQPTIHVITSPEHLGGALGYTWYASMFGYGGYQECLNWVHMYEKTFPGLGGASVVDGGLADSGAVLAHEIGHQLMLHHTWYEAGQPSIREQCVGSASMRPEDIAAGKSDGVRDTPAQSQNGTRNSVTSILRFVNCDPMTGAYTNRTAYAQQSCTSAVGFPDGDKYFNNFNNLMSYGDKTCLRTLTPGQSARARCAYKCMMQKQC